MKLKDEIRHRLETICSNLNEKDFEQLVEQIADNSLKGELRPFHQNGPSPVNHPGK